MARVRKIRLGINTAIRGESPPEVCAKVPNTRSKNTKVNPTTTPTIRLMPIPPRFFTDDTATPISVRIKAVLIAPQRLYFTNKYIKVRRAFHSLAFNKLIQFKKVLILCGILHRH